MRQVEQPLPNPLGPKDKAALQKGQYQLNQALAELDRQSRVGLDTTVGRERHAAALALSEAIMREYFNE